MSHRDISGAIIARLGIQNQSDSLRNRRFLWEEYWRSQHRHGAIEPGWIARGIRVNIVSPPWITDTLKALGMDPSQGIPPEVSARMYVQSVLGKESGVVIEAKR